MSDYYELLRFKPSDFQDDHGNTWCDAAFRGVSEPVKWVVKDTSKPQVGNKYYGHLTDEISKAGKPYQRFRADPRPESTLVNESRDTQESIYRSVALNDAALVFQGQGGPSKAILKMADEFNAWLKEEVVTDIKGKDEVFNPNDYPEININDIPF